MTRKLSAIILMLVLLMGLLAIPAAAVETVGEELVTNGGFEDGDSPLKPTGWTLAIQTGSSSAYKTTGMASGEVCMLLENTGGNGDDYLYQALPADKLKDGVKYVLTADINIEAIGGGIEVAVLKGGYTSKDFASIMRFWGTHTSISTTGGYYRIQTDFTYNANDNVDYGVCFMNNGGKMYIDNVSVKEAKIQNPIVSLHYDNSKPAISVERGNTGAGTELYKDNGNNAARLYKTDSTVITYAPLMSKVNTSATDGAPVTLKCRIKMLSGTGTLRSIQVWTGSADMPGSGINPYTTTNFNIPQEYEDQWLNMEVHYPNFGTTLNQIGFCVRNRMDFLVDDVEVYYDTETEICDGKTVATSVVSPYDTPYENYAGTARLSVPAETVSKTETVEPIVRYLPTDGSTALAVSAIYSTGADGTRRLEKVDVAPLAPVATDTLPARHTEATLGISASDITFDADRTYTVETSILSGLGTLRPLPVQQILPIHQ